MLDRGGGNGEITQCFGRDSEVEEALTSATVGLGNGDAERPDVGDRLPDVRLDAGRAVEDLTQTYGWAGATQPVKHGRSKCLLLAAEVKLHCSTFAVARSLGNP